MASTMGKTVKPTPADMGPVSVVLVSGGADPLHIGHVAMLRAAALMGRVVFALNSDAWLMRKKGYIFMPWEERAVMLRECRSVSQVIGVRDDDGTVCEALERVRPHVFANGGDRTSPNPKEHELCLRLGIKELFNVGGLKLESSSDLIRRAVDNHKNAVPR